MMRNIKIKIIRIMLQGDDGDDRVERKKMIMKNPVGYKDSSIIKKKV